MINSTITEKETETLLSLSKVVLCKGLASLVEEINFNTQPSFRFELGLEDDLTADTRFLLQIRRSCKNTIQLTLHLQESQKRCCLIRVDYNQGCQHTNPPIEENTNVPGFLKKYAGMTFLGSHIHYNIDGYRDAAWALPIDEDTFPVKKFDGNDFVSNFNEIASAFANRINLKTIVRHEAVIPL